MLRARPPTLDDVRRRWSLSAMIGRVAADWVAWHAGYDDPLSSHSVRLRLVQGHAAAALDRCPSGEILVLSLCAGEGRDLIGVLAEHPRREDVRAVLVELDPELAERARATAAEAGLARVEVRTADAALVDGFADAVPADVLLVCGIFGNIPDDDIRHTVFHLPQLCASDATVLWTRHRRDPDLTPTIRSWFAEAGFEELTFDAPEAPPEATSTSRWNWISVGAARFCGDPKPAVPGTRLFTFVD